MPFVNSLIENNLTRVGFFVIFGRMAKNRAEIYQRIGDYLDEKCQHYLDFPPEGLINIWDFKRGVKFIQAEIKWYCKLNRSQRYELHRKEGV